MILFKRYIPILISSMAMLGIAAGCASTGNANKDSSSQDRSVIEVNDTDYTLADYLRKVSGVYVRGSGSSATVKIRGVSTITGDTRPLFVVDGQKLGKSYSYVASQVPVSDIDSIRVLKGSEASRYGLQGGNGVIEITTKD